MVGWCAGTYTVGQWLLVAVVDPVGDVAEGFVLLLFLLECHFSCLRKEFEAGYMVGDGEQGDVEVAECPLGDVDGGGVGEGGPVHGQQREVEVSGHGWCWRGGAAGVRIFRRHGGAGGGVGGGGFVRVRERDHCCYCMGTVHGQSAY